MQFMDAMPGGGEGFGSSSAYIDGSSFGSKCSGTSCDEIPGGGGLSGGSRSSSGSGDGSMVKSGGSASG